MRWFIRVLLLLFLLLLGLFLHHGTIRVQLSKVFILVTHAWVLRVATVHPGLKSLLLPSPPEDFLFQLGFKRL